MNAIYQYAPLIGLLLALFGIIRVLMRSGVDFGGGVNLQSKQKDADDRAAIWSALSSPTGRLDIGAIVLGLAIIAAFISSIS